MKLNYQYRKIASLLSNNSDSDTVIHSVAYDTRKISSGAHVLFFALKGDFRDGHSFIDDAYSRGVRHFIVTSEGSTSHLEGAQEIAVENTFQALQDLAQYHREQFKIPVIAITGSYGKTTVKEWLSELISPVFNVVRSPKSYNSRLGVALSIFEIKDSTDIAIIETGISAPGDMIHLQKMIAPTLGIFTALGSAHIENFDSQLDIKQEKLLLFKSIESFIYPRAVDLNSNNSEVIEENDFQDLQSSFKLNDPIQWKNCQLAIAMAKKLGVNDAIIMGQLEKLEALSMRLETFDGINQNTVINDAYSLDVDSLRHALEYQQMTAGAKSRVVYIGISVNNAQTQVWVEQIVASFPKVDLRIINAEKPVDYSIANSSILIKGDRSSNMEVVAGKFKRQQHQTFLQIDLGSIRKNIRAYKSKLHESTKILCMVKAASYGSDAKKTGVFLEQLGVDYLGVAYPDEGVELRENGVTLPILVMNSEAAAFSTCIQYNLEPAIFSLSQLEAFVQELILNARQNYPIHLKLETGMHRMGIETNEIDALMQKINAQPEVSVASIYSHLSQADVEKSVHVQNQIDRFSELSEKIQSSLSYPIIRHILNSEGIVNHTSAQFDMVRLGIGMYGITDNCDWKDNLSPAIEWFSAVSQVKALNTNDAVGYHRRFIADKTMEIAVIPVGYADGFRRQLSNGKGGVYIKNTFCPTVGSVCMDMIMVDVTGLEVAEKDQVEIIGPQQSIYEFADQLDTIPYEVMTHFSGRIHRKFIEA